MNDVTNNDSGNQNVIGTAQQVESGSTARAGQSVTNPDVQKVIQELRQEVASLPAEKKEEAETFIDQVEHALEKGPKAVRVVETLLTELGTYFPHAIPWFNVQAQQLLDGLRFLAGG